MEIKSSPQAFSTILKAGFSAGILDGLAAILMNLNTNPVRIFQYIASGLLGNKAFTGDLFTALIGLVIHFLIANTWALIFFVVYPKIAGLSKYKVIVGLLYGVIIWLAMNLIVLPLSNTPQTPFDFNKAVFGIIVLVICVGLPVSLIIGKYYRDKSQVFEAGERII